MCGIAGFSRHNFPQLNEASLHAMGDTIRHRGPDASGVYIDEQIGLCHRRLAIIDLSDAGIQPMYSQDKSVVIVFNGEIYNYLELRKELVDEGYPFNSETDTEVIIALYLKYGTDCLDKINGMFAFAIWDNRDKSLFIARDRIGKKPLYYFTDQNGRFAFASEIKAILALPAIPREIRLDALYDFLAYQYVPDPKSIFKHIHKLPPGHFMTLKEHKINIQQYWDVDFSKTSEKSERELVDELTKELEACTQRRMVSDVPLGAFLSGGVDSSGVVAMMANRSSQAVKTCTIAFDDEKFNEAEFAQQVADKYKTEHHEYLVHQNVAEELEHIVSFFDEPFADPSLVPTYFVSQLARQAVTVAIAGDGGDEVFAGYEKYTTDHTENKLRQKFPSFLRRTLFPSLANACARIHHPVFRKAKSLFTSLSASPEMGFYMTNSQLEDRQWQALASDSTKAEIGDYHPSELTIKAYQSCSADDHLSKILYTDMKTYLPGGILVKVDRMSMANSLEVRAPILDKDVIEFAATVPASLKFNNGEKKYLLKEAFKPLLPDDILYRKKMGFSVPLAHWFRDEIKTIAEQYLISASKGIPQFFNHNVVVRFWQEHQSEKTDHSALLWSLLMFEMWYQRYATADV